jgi:ribosomal protein S12 methylthiotransferase
MPRTVSLHLVSLGCPKNRVDAEVMLGVAAASGFHVVDDAADAVVIVVNTCGFVEDAKRESIDTIFSLARNKTEGKCTRLIVTGCLAQRYAHELAAEVPEIDHILGSGDVHRIREALDGSAERVLVGSTPGTLVHASDPRMVSTGVASAYIKIAEGCDRHCSFCVIPQLRGQHRSRELDDVVREARHLAEHGVLEVNLVSQDTSAYGRDLGQSNHSTSLAALVRNVAEVPGLRWIRLLYLYPDELDDELVELLASHPHVVPYVDMPMQHASDAVLTRMKRGHRQARLRRIVERLRSHVPDLTLRSAFIVGFPGETDADFDKLCDFVRWAQFEHLGVFRFSSEEGTSAHQLPDHPTKTVSYRRARKLMALQRRIARANNQKLVGKQLQVLVEGASPEHELVMTGRHAGQAPEVDGQVWFTESDVLPGQMWNAEVVQAADYDVVVRTLGETPYAQATAKRTIRMQLPVVR